MIAREGFMSAAQPLCYLMGMSSVILTNEENFLLEAELFTRICEELKEVFRQQYKEYFYLMKFTAEKEDAMLEEKFIRLIIQDILLTDEYNIKGIAHYTNTYEEVVEEVIAGRNKNPSAIFVRRIIDLHRLVRRDLYSGIIKKITEQYLTAVV